MALTKTQLFTLIGTNLPDNNTGAITPAKVREVATQTADSMLYGVKEVEVLRAPSIVIQAPTALDTALQVTFGAAQKSASDPVMINAAGLITFNTAGVYAVRVKLENGRTGATGTSVLLSRLIKNGAAYGSPAAVKLTSSDETVPTDSRVIIDAAAGDTLVVQIMRDSAGTNFGGLYPQVAVVTAWGTVPSALLVVSRLEAA
jgi:hypothetical protein